MDLIPVMRPLLPRVERIIPYLMRIDERRIYSNFGPLTQAFEDRLCGHFGLALGSVATIANATLGLALALMAKGATPGSLCAMPAWTFVATPQAAVLAGLIPYYVDVDAATWAIDPYLIAEQIASAPAPVGAIMPVAPFGQPLDIAAWERVQAGIGMPVVIDAAAGFDSVKPGSIPAVVSLHATKAMGIGEGGFVISTDTTLIREIRARSNFGFVTRREAERPGTNAKLSEYHAAVGLAGLDEWSESRNQWMERGASYRSAMKSNRVRFQEGFAQNWIATTCVIDVPEGTDRVERALAASGIEMRKWWGAGAHLQAAMASHPRANLPLTEVLASSTIGLPFFRDMSLAETSRVADTVLTVVGA